jgi:hypothetical protein
MKKLFRHSIKKISNLFILHDTSWTSKAYGHGKAFKKTIGYPEWLPLLAVVAHGVSCGTEFAKHEIDSLENIYIGWQPNLGKYSGRIYGKKILWIPHPWPLYRQQKGYAPRENRSGTLAFYPHTTPHDHHVNWSSEGYLDDLKELDEKFHPISIMLHHHDVTIENCELIRSKNLRWFTCGDPFAPSFVDNFYDIVCHHAYGTSPGWGSQVAYVVELGIPYFYYGQEPVYMNRSDQNYPQGIIKPSNDESKFFDYTQSVFAFNENPVITSEARKLVIDLLGLDRPLNKARIKQVLYINYGIELISRYSQQARKILQRLLAVP